MRVGIVFVFLLVASPPTAMAQAPEEEEAGPHSTRDAAIAHFRRGESAYDATRFEEALREFEMAFELSARGELLYNVGLANERLLRWSATIDAFRRYLVEMPDADNRANVEARIALARERLASERVSHPSPIADPPRRSRSPGPAIALSIGGGLAIATGATLLGVGASAIADVEATPSGTRQWSDVSGDVERGNTLRTVGLVVMSVGVAVLVAGVVWLLSGKSRQRREAVLRPVVTF